MLSVQDHTRSRYNIIKGLLRRAFNGESGYTLPEMKDMIAVRLARARDIPEGHKVILAAIRAVEKDNRDYNDTLLAAGIAQEDITPPSRTLTRLSIAERLAGRAVSYQTTAPVPREYNLRRIARCKELPSAFNQRPVTLIPRMW